MSLIKGRGAQAPAGSAARGGTASRFNYRARSAEETKARANRQIGTRDSYLSAEVDFFTPPAGENLVRIMPPTWEGAQHYGVDLYIHYGIGPDKSAFLCLDKMKGERCPLCEERARAADAGEEALAKHLRPRSRVLVWAINRKDPAKGPLAWSMAAGLDKDIVNASHDQQTKEWLAIDDPSDKGFDIQFKRVGTDDRTEYTGIAVARRPSPLHDDQATADRWLEFAANHPLPSLLQFKTPEEMEAAFMGTTTERKGEGGGQQAQQGSGRSGGRIAPRGSAASASGGAGGAAAAAPDPQGGGGNGSDLPSWDEVHKMSEKEIEAMLTDLKVDTSDCTAEDEAQLQDYACAKLGIAAPIKAPPPAASGGAAQPSWREKLNKMRTG